MRIRLPQKQVAPPAAGHELRSVAKTFGPPVQVPGGEFFYQDGERRKLETFDIDPTDRSHDRAICRISCGGGIKHIAEPDKVPPLPSRVIP
jgi:hypothetical protein